MKHDSFHLLIRGDAQIREVRIPFVSSKQPQNWRKTFKLRDLGGISMFKTPPLSSWPIIRPLVIQRQDGAGEGQRDHTAVLHLLIVIWFIHLEKCHLSQKLIFCLTFNWRFWCFEPQTYTTLITFLSSLWMKLCIHYFFKPEIILTETVSVLNFVAYEKSFAFWL